METLKELKAFELHTSTDTTRPELCSIYVEYNNGDDTYRVQSTNGRTALYKVYPISDWKKLRNILHVECNLMISDKPITGYIVSTFKRIKGNIDCKFYTKQSPQYLGKYPSLASCIPLDIHLNNEAENRPYFSFQAYALVDKTNRLLGCVGGMDSNLFYPKWTTKIGAAIQEYKTGHRLLVMPIKNYLD